MASILLTPNPSPKAFGFDTSRSRCIDRWDRVCSSRSICVSLKSEFISNIQFNALNFGMLLMKVSFCALVRHSGP